MAQEGAGAEGPESNEFIAPAARSDPEERGREPEQPSKDVEHNKTWADFLGGVSWM